MLISKIVTTIKTSTLQDKFFLLLALGLVVFFLSSLIHKKENSKDLNGCYSTQISTNNFSVVCKSVKPDSLPSREEFFQGLDPKRYPELDKRYTELSKKYQD